MAEAKRDNNREASLLAELSGAVGNVLADTSTGNILLVLYPAASPPTMASAAVRDQNHVVSTLVEDSNGSVGPWMADSNGYAWVVLS